MGGREEEEVDDEVEVTLVVLSKLSFHWTADFGRKGGT